MAEHVQLRSERMLSEYEQMKKLKLFMDEEIRRMIKKRETYEYRIASQKKSIKDFCEYIAYERGILSIITERKKQQRLMQKKTSVEHSVENHIKNLYKISLSLFPKEQRLWDNYIKFLKFCKFKPEVSTIFEKMLQYHGDKPAVWLRAIMWEYHEAHNMDRVKNLLLRSLQRHPENTDLHIKFFNIMLTEASTMSAEPVSTDADGKPQSLQSIGLERVTVVYESSKKKIHQVQFLADLLEIAQGYPFAKSLQKMLVGDIMEMFPRSEITWNTLAQCELKGFHIKNLSDDTKDTAEDKSKENDVVTVSESTQEKSTTEEPDVEMSDVSSDVTPQESERRKTLKRRIELCVIIYETAVEELKTEEMWSLYINAMLEINQDLSTQQVLKRKVLGAAMRGAHLSKLMSETHYLYYIEMLLDAQNMRDDYILEVAQCATTMHSSSVKLWELAMRIHIQRDEPQKLYTVFRKAVKKLASEANPLWRLLLQYHQAQPNSTTKVEEVFREAIAQNNVSFESFKPLYVEWTALTKGILAARMVYNDLLLIPPPSFALHESMINFERNMLKPDIEEWRKCLDQAAHYFGKTRTDVWLNYITFERDFGDPKNMSLLFNRAKATLNDDLIENFLSEHALITIGIM